MADITRLSSSVTPSTLTPLRRSVSADQISVPPPPSLTPSQGLSPQSKATETLQASNPLSESIVQTLEDGIQQTSSSKMLSRSDSMPMISGLQTASESSQPTASHSASVDISPRHFKLIEDLAKEGKNPTEIAQHLKNAEKLPGDSGAARYKDLSLEQVTEQVKASPQFDRGNLISTQSKDKTHQSPFVRAADRLPEEFGKIETQLTKLGLTESMRTKLEGKLKSTIASVERIAINPHGLPPAPTRAEMLHKPNNVFQKLYQQATPTLPQEIQKIESELQKLSGDIGKISIVLPEGALLAPKPDLETLQKKFKEDSAHLETQLGKLKQQAALISDPIARSKFVQEKITPVINAIEVLKKPLDQAVLILTLHDKIDQSLTLTDKLSHKREVQEVKNSIVTLETRRQGLLQKLAQAQQAPPPPPSLSPLDQAMQRSAQQFEVDALKMSLDKVNGQLEGLREKAGHGGMEWGRVKKEFLESDRREFFMKAVIDFRQSFVLQTFNDVVHDLKAKELAPLQSQLKGLETVVPKNAEAIQNKKAEIDAVTKSWDKIDKRAVGSTDLTSDFDMTVLADRPGMDTAVMKEVNSRFQAKYGTEAGNIFDTNLYVSGGGPAIKKEVKEGAKVWADPAAKASHDQGQDVIALVKQRMYSSPEEWTGFVTEMSKGLEANLRKVTPALSESVIQSKLQNQMERFTAADQHCTERHAKIEQGIEALLKIPENRSKSHYDLEIIAMNRLFESHSEQADTIKQEWAKLPESTPTEKAAKDRKWAEYTRQDAVAQLYANEPYFSEGPVRHVVGNEQALKGLKLVGDRQVIKPDTVDGKVQTLKMDSVQALESMSENLGDSKKEFAHLKHEGKAMGDIAIKASKYMGRLTRAIDYALPPEKQTPKMRELIGNLQKAEVELIRIRKGGQLPPDFVGTTEDYALKVLRDKGLGHLTTDDPSTINSSGQTVPGKKAVDKLQDCFEQLTLQAAIQVRTELAMA